MWHGKNQWKENRENIPCLNLVKKFFKKLKSCKWIFELFFTKFVEILEFLFIHDSRVVYLRTIFLRPYFEVAEEKDWSPVADKLSQLSGSIFNRSDFYEFVEENFSPRLHWTEFIVDDVEPIAMRSVLAASRLISCPVTGIRDTFKRKNKIKQKSNKNLCLFRVKRDRTHEYSYRQNFV